MELNNKHDEKLLYCSCVVFSTTGNFYGIIPMDNGEVDEMFTYVEDELAKARDNDEKVRSLRCFSRSTFPSLYSFFNGALCSKSELTTHYVNACGQHSVTYQVARVL